MEFKMVTVDSQRRRLTSRVLSEGHGAFGEPDNSYEDGFYVGSGFDMQFVRVFDSGALLLDQNDKIVGYISEYSIPDNVLKMLDPKAYNKRVDAMHKKYLERKKFFEINGQPS